MLCIISVIFLKPAFSQVGALQTEYYSINDGLSDRLVVQTLQNSQGLLWIATPNGLNKFDGYEFTVYNNHPENECQINDVDIKRIAEDKNGNLILTYRNNYVFFDLLNPFTNQVEKISLLPGDGVRGIVRDLKINRKGDLQVFTNHNDTLKLYQFIEKENFKLLFQFYQSHQTQTAPASILQLLDDHFLINDSEKGLLRVNSKGEVLKIYDQSNFECLEVYHPYPGNTHFIHQDKNGRIWVSFVQIPGIYLYHENSDFFELVPGLPDGFYTTIWEDLQGNILLPKTTGIGYWPEVLDLYCINPNMEIVDFSYLLDLGTRLIDVFSKDFFSTLFLGVDTGIKIVQNNRHKIKTYLAQNLEKGQRGTVMRGIVGDNNGTVFFAREVNNWYMLDTQTDNLDTISLTDPYSGEVMEFNCCMDIHYENGFLWGISCQDSRQAQLIKYKISTKETTTYPYPHRFRSFVKSKDGKFWLTYFTSSREGGLVAFDTLTTTWTEYVEKEGNNPLKDTDPTYIHESEAGILWIGTNNGLYQLDRDSKKHELIQMVKSPGEKGLLSNHVYAIHEESKGGFWIGTSNGLNYYNPKTDFIEAYDMSNGLANNQVCGILSDELDNLWISTYNGLSYFDTDTKLFRNFYKTDGLSEDEFNRFSFYRDETGKYYFGGTNGLNTFMAEDLLSDKNNPPLVLTKLTRFNSQLDSLLVQTSRLDNLEEIVISPYDTYFQLNFSLPNYIQSRKNQFASMLEGYERNWTYLENTPQIRYNNLPSGSYKLHLRGADPNGNWTKQDLIVNIRVKPFWYKTNAAVFSFLLVLALLIYGIFQYQLEQRLKVERLRMKISSDLHDEVSGLLSGIAMQTDVLKSITKDENSKSRLHNIGAVSRTAMAKMSDVIWSIDSRKDKVEDLIHRMQEHSADILEPVNIRYRFKIGKIDQQQRMPVNIRQNLYFIFKEAINNIVKHSDASKVQIFFGNNGTGFELMVKDNGSGSKHNKSTKKTGQGLSNLKMRAQRINADLDIVNHDGFTIKLKMKKFAKP